jgi:SAM-dependent methyltransferase
MSYETIVELLEIISKPAKDAPGLPYKTLLDIGCGRGDFVEEMRASGCKAVGVDLAPRRKSKYLLEGDARNLAECFGKRKFDVITANGVLTIGGLLEALCITDPKIGRPMTRGKHWGKKEDELLHENALKILQSCYTQLNAPGVFINLEDFAELDHLIYTKKEAKTIGFEPIEFRKHGAILGKV